MCVYIYVRERGPVRGSENSAQAFPVFPWPAALEGWGWVGWIGEGRGGACGSAVGGIMGRLQ